MPDGPQKHLLDEEPNDSEPGGRRKRHRGYGGGHSLAIRSHGKKQLRHEDYTVGVICALGFEMSAVRYMLDDEHSKFRDAQDPNIYILGELSGHNVVIACLPGNQGKGAAAIVSTNMERSFPEIKLRLLVGIGGGVPSDKHDIRLGDVVIGMPDGPHGGVIQYDLGKDTEEAFILKGYLAQSPYPLRSAVEVMQSDHLATSNQINEFLFAMLQKGERFSAYQRPSTYTDILFEVDCAHIPGQDTCNNCDRGKVIHRHPRKSNAPRIHYGLIASGDRVMRSATKRCLISQKIGDVLCFEMEAAGILTEFPCLVIRGISDYADSHKNDIWQHYAAAAAAGCAKELLCYLGSRTPISRHEVDGMSRRSLGPGFHRTTNTFPGSPERRNTLSLSKEQKQTLLESLKFDQIDVRKMNIKKAHAKTCKWLLKIPEYLEWLDDTKLSDHHGVLWIKGKPGAGKSTLMKFALANAPKTMKGRIILCFFFNARGEDLEKSTIGMYRSLLWQLLSQSTEPLNVFDYLKITTWNSDEDYQWSLESLQDLFRQAIQSLRQSSIVCFIDALDECEEKQIREMLQFFEDIGQSAVEARLRFHVLFSSRHYPHITINRGLELVLEGHEGHNQDIANYVDSELKTGHSNLAKQIKSELQTKASGVFMWVVLVVQILNKEYDRGRIRALRQKLQDIPSDLHDLFRDILKRDGGNRDELLLCIQWVLFARQPLKPKELYCALLSGDELADLRKWDADEITDDDIKRYILDCSKGLAEITQSKAPTIQFIHESVRDFLLKENGLADIWTDLGKKFEGQSHERLRQCCYNYMRIDISTHLDLNEPLPKASTPEMVALRKSATNAFPFLEYSVCNVLYHSDIAQGSGFAQGTFLQSFQLPCWNRLNNLLEKFEVRRHTPNVSLPYILGEYNLSNLIEVCHSMLSWLEIENERYGLPLFAALATGSKEALKVFLKVYARSQPSGSRLHELCSKYAQNTDGQATLGRDFNFSNQRTVLSYIAELGDEVLFALLLETGIFMPHGKDTNGRTPLSWAAENGKGAVVKLLLADQRVDPDSKDNIGRTPLLWAAGRGHEAVAKLLLADQRVDPDSTDNGGLTPLLLAAGNGHEAVVKLLLADQRVDPDSTDNGGLTPLLLAAGNGHEAVVKLLLADQRVDPDSTDNGGRTPLLWAAKWGHEAVVKLLLADQRVDPDSKDNIGLTPLLWAAKWGNEAVVKLLLADQRVDPDSTDNGGRTPLLWAAKWGNEAVVKLLLADHRVNQDAKDKYGRTPGLWADGGRRT